MPMLAVLRSLLRLMVGSDLRLRGDLAASTAIEGIGIGLGVLGPYLLKLVVDALAAGRIEPLSLTALIAAFVLAWSGTNLTSAVKYVFTTRIIGALSRHLVEQAMTTHLPVVARERESDSGRLLGILERLPYSLQLVVDGLLGRAAPLLIQVGISLIVVATLVPPRYVALLAIVLGGYFVATRLTSKRFNEQAKATNAAMASVSQALGDILRNAKRVVFNGNLAGEIDNVAREGMARQAANTSLAWQLVGTSAAQFLVVGGGLVVLLTLGGFDAARGRLTVGDFVLLQAYAFRLAVPLGGLGFIVRQAAVSIANVGEVLELAGETRIQSAGTTPPVAAAAIRLEQIRYRYGERTVLSGIDAEIAPGSFIVVVGPNGAGKSTLARLIAGLLSPAGGRVVIDDIDMAAIPEAARHGHVLYVPQFIGLFNRSLGDNALYPPTRQSQAELGSLLQDWRFYDDGRPVDFGLAVGEQGERLSGGQIQKLELARLMGVHAPAIILDETTSSLDAPAEKRAISALRTRHAGRTTLILITHRLGLARDADQVFFMREGLLLAGRHDELITTNTEYRQFCQGGADAAA